MRAVVASWNQAVTVRLVTCCDRHRSGTGNANDTAACRGRMQPKDAPGDTLAGVRGAGLQA